MARGKSINLFLMDGDANGRMKCTLANWTGVAYKIPRTELDKCKERDDLKQSGVYFLFRKNEETGDSVVYIGQAGARKNGEGIFNRLQEHKRNPEKDYWIEAIVFTTSYYPDVHPRTLLFTKKMGTLSIPIIRVILINLFHTT